MNKITHVQIEQIKSLYLSGVGTPKIAKAIGCSKRTVQLKLKKANIFKGRKQFSVMEIAKMEEMFQNGKSILKIAEFFHVGERLIRKTLVSNGVYSAGEKVWSAEEKEKAIKLYCSGKTISEISSTLNVTHSSVAYILKTNEVWEYKGTRKYDCDIDFFQTIDTEEKAYWLGFLGADGCVSLDKHRACLHIGIHKDDKEHLELFRKNIKSNNPIKIKNKDNTCNIDIYLRDFVNRLTENGLCPRKTFSINWKSITKNIPDNLIVHFIRGYFDGDGSWSGKKRVKFQIACASKHFIYPLQKELVNSCDLNFTKIGFRNNCYYLEYGGRFQLKRIADYLYNDANIFLARKKDKIYGFLNIWY